MRRFVLLVCLTLLSSAARAQAPDPDVERARALHEEGTAALEGLRFAEARDHFLAALRLHPDPGAAYNLGLAYRGTGEAGAAIEVWRRLLDGEFGEVPESARADIRTLIDEMGSARGRIEVRLSAPREATLSVDGLERGVVRAGEPLVMAADAGRRLLRVEADGHLPEERAVIVERGGHHRAELTLEAIPRSESIWESPVFWVITGLVVAGGVVAIAVGTQAPYERPPMSTEPFGVAHALVRF